MSSVGYGNLIATTFFGRLTTLVIIIIGAFLLSLLVAIITDIFTLDENKADALDKIRSDQLAVNLVVKAFKYNTERSKRYRLLRDGNVNDEHVPSLEEI